MFIKKGFKDNYIIPEPNKKTMECNRYTPLLYSYDLVNNVRI